MTTYENKSAATHFLRSVRYPPKIYRFYPCQKAKKPKAKAVSNFLESLRNTLCAVIGIAHHRPRAPITPCKSTKPTRPV